VLAEDERAPIVYLRPFDSDGAEVATAWRSRRLRISPRAGVEPTYEQRLARTLRKVGPFVAIGDPSERLPQLGAARVYSTNEDWQAKVDELMARAGVVLLHAGKSEGITWEVRHVVVMNDSDRVILSLPVQAKRNRPSRQERYDTFRRLFGDAFPQTLPEHIGESQFLYFEGDWTPRLLKGRAASPPAWRGTGSRPPAPRTGVQDHVGSALDAHARLPRRPLRTRAGSQHVVTRELRETAPAPTLTARLDAMRPTATVGQGSRSMLRPPDPWVDRRVSANEARSSGAVAYARRTCRPRGPAHADHPEPRISAFSNPHTARRAHVHARAARNWL
jgi:hypothetical protein